MDFSEEKRVSEEVRKLIIIITDEFHGVSFTGKDNDGHRTVVHILCDRIRHETDLTENSYRVDSYRRDGGIESTVIEFT